jgi:hypothetical protein
MSNDRPAQKYGMPIEQAEAYEAHQTALAVARQRYRLAVFAHAARQAPALRAAFDMLGLR